MVSCKPVRSPIQPSHHNCALRGNALRIHLKWTSGIAGTVQGRRRAVSIEVLSHGSWNTRVSETPYQNEYNCIIVRLLACLLSLLCVTVDTQARTDRWHVGNSLMEFMSSCVDGSYRGKPRKDHPQTDLAIERCGTFDRSGDPIPGGHSCREERASGAVAWGNKGGIVQKFVLSARTVRKESGMRKRDEDTESQDRSAGSFILDYRVQCPWGSKKHET